MGPEGLNTNPFDLVSDAEKQRQGKESGKGRKKQPSKGDLISGCTGEELDNFLQAVLDDLCPISPETNERKANGMHTSHVYVNSRLDYFHSFAPGLKVSFMIALLHGNAWAWRVRPVLHALGIDPWIYEAGVLPPELVFDPDEREEALAKREELQQFRQSQEGDEAQRKLTAAQVKERMGPEQARLSAASHH
ncbi:hypothetical protein JCM8547_001363 [Rhodosporidiobolus lusitaniae]